MSRILESKYQSYPPIIRVELLKLRQLILKIANEDENIDFIGEDLKWGEPSFLTKTSGTTLRIDWKDHSPDHISIFVNCRTKLISIIRDLFPSDFTYIGNREIRIPVDAKYSRQKLEKCIELILTYNLIKDSF